MSVELPGLNERAKIHAALGEPARLANADAQALGDASPAELGRQLRLPSNLLAHHLRVLEEAGVVARRRSEGDRRRRYLRLVSEALGALAPALRLRPRRVVFVCVRNSARSQLAAALWTERSMVPGASAGTRPASHVHPRALRTARRHGLDLVGARTAHIDDVVGPDDLVVAVCDNAHEQLDGETGRRLHWSVADPAALDADFAFEAAFDEIDRRVDRLVPHVTSGADHD
ncbi:MAG: ArsR family transcriptional regulator [Stackebrandtia sp.]